MSNIQYGTILYRSELSLPSFVSGRRDGVVDGDGDVARDSTGTVHTLIRGEQAHRWRRMVTDTDTLMGGRNTGCCHARSGFGPCPT